MKINIPESVPIVSASQLVKKTLLNQLLVLHLKIL